MSNSLLRDSVPDMPSLAPTGESLQGLIRRLRTLWRLERIRHGRRAAVRAAVAEGLDARMLGDIGVGCHEAHQPRGYIVEPLIVLDR